MLTTVQPSAHSAGCILRSCQGHNGLLGPRGTNQILVVVYTFERLLSRLRQISSVRIFQEDEAIESVVEEFQIQEVDMSDVVLLSDASKLNRYAWLMVWCTGLVQIFRFSNSSIENADESRFP